LRSQVTHVFPPADKSHGERLQLRDFRERQDRRPFRGSDKGSTYVMEGLAPVKEGNSGTGASLLHSCERGGELGSSAMYHESKFRTGRCMFCIRFVGGGTLWSGMSLEFSLHCSDGVLVAERFVTGGT
jgi:hypothetical protein